MTAAFSWLRKQLPGVVALVLVTALFFAARLPSGKAEAERVATRFSFAPQSIALPGGFTQQGIRKVNKAYRNIDAWISSVGAGIAMTDLDGDGLSNDLCVTDPRIDQVVVTPTPGKGAQRYAPFALSPGNLPMNAAMAPMGCAPGDFNEDGRTDLLVYLWGRTPIVFLAKPAAAGQAARPSASAFEPTELVAGVGRPGGAYTGPQWNSNAVAISDFDGDGHDDIYVGNYFPDSPVLDPTKNGGVAMNESLSNAHNGGADHIMRCAGITKPAKGAAKDAPATVSYQQVDNALPKAASKGWVLASAATDLDGDQRPELYMANDHGPDYLFHNTSTSGHIKFSSVVSTRSATAPKSKQVGRDSFKGMGVDFADLNHDGLYDMFVSDITTTFGIQESNLAFMSTAKDQADLRAQLSKGRAPWKDQSSPLGIAWSGWAWDVKLDDFDNSGDPQIVQANGFVKGEVNRWPQLQELAASNDALVSNPFWWPHVKSGDDIAGSQRLRFYARDPKDGPNGKYANVSDQLGLAVPVPTRGIATGDADGDGRLDFAVARQWDEPVFYHNQSPSTGSYLQLHLVHEAPGVPAPGVPGSPVTSAQVTVTTPDGRTIPAHVDGGSGHSGKRSTDVHIGLGDGVTGPVRVHLQWRDRAGQVRQQDLSLSPGAHSLTLGTQATER